nr:ATP synthase CF0 subunit I [Ostreobium quekettii]
MISSNLGEADRRAEKAQEKILEAKAQLELANKRSEEISKQGISTIKNEKVDSQTQTVEIIQRLDQLKLETLKSQQRKVSKLISRKVIYSSLARVQEKIQDRLDFKFQTTINNFYIALFRNYGF